MKRIFAILFVCIYTGAYSQSDSISSISEISAFQKTLSHEYSTPGKSPLEEKDLKKFKGHDFFPINLKYRVKAKLIVSDSAQIFQMKTSTSRLPEYKKYGAAVFSIEGLEYKLNIYQSVDLSKRDGYKDYLFLPFTDNTNGDQTYINGRYIDLRIPKDGNDIIIDFNQAYNPYCAYSTKYSCPIVPKENHLNTSVLAGVKLKKKK